MDYEKLLTDKLEEIRKQKEQAVANLNAIQGAEQMLILLISEYKEVGKNEDNND